MIIGIAGQKASGKDTLCDMLIHNMPVFKRHAFADVVKDCLEPFGIIFGWSREDFDDQTKKEVITEYGFSIRNVMQCFGTGFGRSLHKNIWVILFDKMYGKEYTIVSDVRFDNEADYVRKNGVLIHIHRSQNHTDDHESEQQLEIMDCDIFVNNDGTIEDLKDAAHKISLMLTCPEEVDWITV